MARRILLVDDEVGITRGLAMYLAENGDCEVRTENRGSRALAAAREFRPDLILLDIVMPDAEGGAIASAINIDPLLKGTPVVFLTALVSRREAGGEYGHIGGRPFLAKPVDPDTVLACIDQHVTRR